MSQNGFVKFDRKIKDWGWYTDVNTFKLFFHLITFAQYTDSEFLGVKIKRGQIARSLVGLAKETGLTVQQVRSAINRLKSTNEITSTSTNKFTVFTVNSYDKYQTSQQAFQHLSNKRPTNDQQHNKNNKNNKNNKKVKNIETALTGEEKSDVFASRMF